MCVKKLFYSQLPFIFPTQKEQMYKIYETREWKDSEICFRNQRQFFRERQEPVEVDGRKKYPTW